MLYYLLIAYFVLLPVTKAFLYRARGMEHPGMNTSEARWFFWAIPFSLDAGILSFLLGNHHIETISLIMILSFLSGWLGATIRHANWQSPSNYNYVIMGLITTAMLFLMFLPLIFFHPWLLQFIPIGITGIMASYFGYRMALNNKRLVLFGVIWCVPNDSSWEEFFIGSLPFGITISAIGLKLLGIF
jgi:hypothetical protein